MGLFFAFGQLSRQRLESRGRKILKVILFSFLNLGGLIFASKFVVAGCCAPDVDEPEIQVSTCVGMLKPSEFNGNQAFSKCCLSAEQYNQCKPEMSDPGEPGKNLCRECLKMGAQSCTSCLPAGDSSNDAGQKLDRAGPGFDSPSPLDSQTGGQLDARTTGEVVTPDTQSGFADGKQSAASAGASATGRSKNDKKDAATGANSFSGNNKNSSGSGISNAGGPTGSGSGSSGGIPSLLSGGASGSGSKATSDGQPQSAGAVDAGAIPTVGTSAASAGGSGGGNRGGFGGGLFGSSGGSGAEGGDGATSGRFGPSAGGDSSGAEVPALGTLDPEDYFTRTGLEDNLFKKVEKKLTEKQTNWILQDNASKSGKEALMPEGSSLEKSSTGKSRKKPSPTLP